MPKHDSRRATSSTPTRSIVGEAFNAAINDKEGENMAGDSGTDQLKCGDYCAVMVQTKQGEAKKAGNDTFMIIGKFKQFGDVRVKFPLNSSWPTGVDTYCASVFVLGVKGYTNSMNEECLHPTDEIICTLIKIDLSCILPVSPTIERTSAANNSSPVC